MKYWYEWGRDEVVCPCLWPLDEETKEAFGYPVDIRKLPISKELYSFLCKLGKRQDKALASDCPPNIAIWRKEEEELFYGLARYGYERLCSELGSEYQIIYGEQNESL